VDYRVDPRLPMRLGTMTGRFLPLLVDAAGISLVPPSPLARSVSRARGSFFTRSLPSGFLNFRLYYFSCLPRHEKRLRKNWLSAILSKRACPLTAP
jgi:hypothetical protein